MPLKKTVAMERRIDLASLFCLIARHGPAVLMTLVVIGCSLAGFIMLRNMREKRRRRKAAAGAEGRDSSGSHHAAHRDAALGLGEDEEPCAEEAEVSRRGSTDDEEHGYDSYFRHRSPYKDKLPDRDTAVNEAPYSFFWHRHTPRATESRVEETGYSSERNFSHASTEGVTEEIPEAKEPELINDVGGEEKEKVIEADSSEDITSTTEDVSEDEFVQEEETLHFQFNSQLCSAPAPTLSPNDGRENAEETDTQRQEHDLENSITPVLKQDESLSDPHIKDQEVTLDQAQTELEQNLPLQRSEPAAVAHSDYEQQTDIPCNDNTVSSTLSVEAMEEDLVEVSHNETCKSEPFKPVQTKDDCSLASTTYADGAADLSSNGQQQSEPPVSPTSDTEIDQNGRCPQELSHLKTDAYKSSNQKDIGLIETECPQATSDDANISNLEAVSHSVDVSVAEDKSLAPQEMIQREETEPSLLSEDTSAVQNQQCQEMLSQVQDGNQAHTDNLSDQKDNISEEKQTLPICEENNLNTLNQKGQSSHVDFMHEECSEHPPALQSQVYEVMSEETSPSGLTTDVTPEISTVTEPLVQTNDQKPLEGTPDLDTETALPPQTCQKDDSTDKTDISATTRDKIESMVEQMMADVYKDVTHTALEAKPMKLEESKSSELARDSNGIAPDNLVCEEVEEREVVISSNTVVQSTEVVVNSVNNLAKAEEEVKKEGLVASDASENKCQNVTFNDYNIPVTEAVPNPQDANHSEERVEHLVMDKNVENEISVPEDAHLGQQTIVEITQPEQSISLEQADELQAQPVLDINGTVRDNLANEQIVKAVEQKTHIEDISSTQMQAEVTVSCPEVSNIEKVEDQKAIQSDVGENVDNVTTSYQFERQSEQKESEVLLDIDGVSNKSEVEKLLEKEKDAQEILPGIETKVLEITETLNEVQSEQKEPEVLSDFDSGLSYKTEFEVGNVLLDKAESVQEIPSGIETEVLENTATLNVVQSEQKESEIHSDTGNSLSNMTVKSSKVVIVCRTVEASISTVEMSDSEDVVDDETSYSELTSSKSCSCQDTDISRAPANEEACADVVGSSHDTLAAETVIVEMAPEQKQLTETEKRFDLTSHVALDIPQDSSAFMESTEQIQQKDNGTSTPSLESGISSMMVSPEEEESCKVIGQDAPTTQICVEKKVSASVFTTDGVFMVTEEEAITMEIGSLEISTLEELSDELSMINEDSFGSEIEDCYNKAMEEFMVQVADDIKVTSEDVTKGTVKAEKEQACATNKQNGEKADSEKTEISIMEATMDHNEWITDGNYQVLPWMTAASFSKDSTNTDLKDAVENKSEAQASSSEESVENAKKVLAVQPMPQNVNVTFRVHYVTLTPLQTVAVTGDQPELGAWKSVIPLEKTKDGYWTCVASLPAETDVEWKFVILENGEVCRWEECGNRLLYTGYGDDLLVHKWWGFL